MTVLSQFTVQVHSEFCHAVHKKE